MKKHKHDALIRQWLDLGCPPVECRENTGKWWPIDDPRWNENGEYRLVLPPKVKPEGWVNLYRCQSEHRAANTSHAFRTEAVAREFIDYASNYITTIRIEWEQS